jgi:hypothetical protein
MICGQCGTLQPDESLFCTGCEHRLTAKEITLSGTLVAMLILGILLCGAGGSWLVIGWASPTHKAFEAKSAPVTNPGPPPAKPSPAIASVDELSYKPVIIPAPQPQPAAAAPAQPASTPAAKLMEPVAKLVAPLAKLAAPVQSKPAPIVATRTQKAVAPVFRVPPHPLAHTASMTQQAGAYSFGPYNFRLLAHQRHGFNIAVPQGARFDHATLSIAARASGGYGPRLRVQVYRDQQPYFDSSRSDDVAQTLRVSSGNYLVVLENDAIAFPRNVVFSARVTPSQRP